MTRKDKHLASYGIRRHGSAPSDPRTQFERDRDRILYSSAFRRLAGVTQVAAVREVHLLHNRLTHSLKVAQLGRRMAQQICGENKAFDGGISRRYCRRDFPDIGEAAGLAHDIGHPPFGHTAEVVLKDKMSEYGGFEGNAQSFRILTKLAVNSRVTSGLNLTQATLNAVLKYPRYKGEEGTGCADLHWPYRQRGAKWGVYRSEEKDFDFARKGMKRCMRSPAAILMDWADDVSYVVHDLYDYFRAGIMPLHALRNECPNDFLQFAHSRRGTGYGKKFDESRFESEFEELIHYMPDRKWSDKLSDRRALDQFQHDLLDRFFPAIKPKRRNDDSWTLDIDIKAEYQVEALKELTFYYVINQPGMALVQRGQRKIIATLFDDLMDLFSKRRTGRKEIDADFRVPALIDDIYDIMVRLEDEGKEKPRKHAERLARAVCDYICALTEDQAINLYERLTGQSVAHGSIFGNWF
ncbi:deoxyguanosinetriphosphate triphosphohydrolase family protein [Streptomyces sp. NPDC091217]|uniref:deoxyguanosinetriphosphate triphosphohydrolase family protein n=1 Tax=Streptomyces sp. NPDC091217 TaxID=3365975 RepID=UPI003825B91E